MNEIKEYKTYYLVTIKGGETVEIPEEAGKHIQQDLVSSESKSGFIRLGDAVYNKYEILSVKPKTIIDTVEEFILSQPKHIRDKVNQYAKGNNVTWNSIPHVQNFISANT